MMKRKDKDRTYYAEERRILKKAMLEKRLVVFVGSGASVDAEMPSWHEAVLKIAEKLGISKIDDIDYVKIPQFYYNARGNKEYVELMRDIFKYNEDLCVCDVHRNILKLNTRTIITTNYDNLIEKAAEENSEFIQVISQDRDLPYRTVEKEIIKIHGDFESGNFVLKEDDYLNYSKNFKLIEAYIKSLIATNVILFVGYSFRDPDVKQIFSWVKEILEEDFQRAYMLEVIKEFDTNEYEYYKNLGVNIIYASEMNNDFDATKASDYTNKFLEYIMEEDANEDIIDDLYVRSQTFANLNYICKNYLDRIFNKCSIMINGDVLYAIDDRDRETNELLTDIFDGKRDKIETKIEVIKSVVLKSRVKSVGIYKKKGKGEIQRKIINIEAGKRPEFVNAIENFDFDLLKCIREENEANLTDRTPELYLEQAYISYILFEYVKAYRYLRISSRLFYKKKQFIWYFISEVNRKNMGDIIQKDIHINYNDSEFVKIKNEVNALDIETVYSKIPTKEIGEKDFLQDLYTFRTYYRLFQDTYLISKRTEKESKMKYAMYAGIPEYEKLRVQIKDCYCYDLYNYIMVDRYREDVEIYRLFAKTIINSACSADLKVVDFLQEHEKLKSGNIYVETLEKFDVYIIIRYMESDELKRLLKENCNRYININDEARTYLQNIAPNIAQIKSFNEQYFEVYLTLAGYIVLDKKLVEETLKALCQQFNYYFVSNNHNEIIRFLWWAEKQKVYDFDIHNNCLAELIERLLEGISTTEMKNYCQELLMKCLAIYKAMGTPYISKKLNLLVTSGEYNILSKIYPFVNEKNQECIKEIFDNWDWEKGKQFDTYESLVANGIIDSKENIEKDILSDLKQVKLVSKQIKPNRYVRIIGLLTNLYLNDKIIMKKEVFDEISKSDIASYEWMIDVNNYNYKDFDVSWLSMCTNKFLETIASIPSVKDEISKKVKEAYLSNCIDNHILKRYFEYFV